MVATGGRSRTARIPAITGGSGCGPGRCRRSRSIRRQQRRGQPITETAAWPLVTVVVVVVTVITNSVVGTTMRTLTSGQASRSFGGSSSSS